MTKKKIYKFLFKIIDDQVWIYLSRGDQICCIKRDGREARQFDGNFWTQWQQDFDFIPARHEIDFAFILIVLKIFAEVLNFQGFCFLNS